MSLPCLILGVLSKENLTGYWVTKKFDATEIVGTFWKASHQQVYRELTKLYEKGFVKFSVKVNDGKPDSKIYQITKEGKEALCDWYTKPEALNTLRDVLCVKVSSCTYDELPLVISMFIHQIELLDQLIGTIKLIETDSDDDFQKAKNEIVVKRALAHWESTRKWCIESRDKLETFIESEI